MRFFTCFILWVVLATTGHAQDAGFWVQNCALPRLPCHIAGGGVIIWRDTLGQVRGVVRPPMASRVSLRVGNQMRPLGSGRGFEIGALGLKSLHAPNAMIVVEFSDGEVMYHPTQTLPGMLATLPAPETDAIPTPLNHLAAEQDHLTTPPQQLVPSTKPQVEFAIRAQGGQSMFNETGR